MKLVLGNKVVTFGLSKKGKEFFGYILAVLFLTFVLASPIILSYLYYFL